MCIIWHPNIIPMLFHNQRRSSGGGFPPDFVNWLKEFALVRLATNVIDL